MAQLMCCAYRLRAFVFSALAAACLRLALCCCCSCCCNCLCARFFSNAWRCALLSGGLSPRYVPMDPRDARNFFCMLPTGLDSRTLDMDWTPGLLQSLPPRIDSRTPGFQDSEHGLDSRTPGLLTSRPWGLTPALLLAADLSGAPGRGALDDECCTSERMRSFVGVFTDTS